MRCLLLAAVVWTPRALRRGAPAVWLTGRARDRRGRTPPGGAGPIGSGAGRRPAPLAYRYFAGRGRPLPAARALLSPCPSGSGGRPPAQGGRGPRSTRPVTAAPPRGSPRALTAAFVATCTLSTVSLARAWEEDRSAEYLQTAAASLPAAGPAPLLDQLVPADVVWPLRPPRPTAPPGSSPGPEDRPPFATCDDRAAGARRRRPPRAGAVGPACALVPGPVPGCGYRCPPGTRRLDVPLRPDVRGVDLDAAAGLHGRGRRCRSASLWATAGRWRRRSPPALDRSTSASPATVSSAATDGGARDRASACTAASWREPSPDRPARSITDRAGSAGARRASRCAGRS